MANAWGIVGRGFHPALAGYIPTTVLEAVIMAFESISNKVLSMYGLRKRSLPGFSVVSPNYSYFYDHF